MIEDKLNKEERIRLECLNQANLTHQMTHASAEQVIETASRYEKYLREDRSR